jgi:hypothetical protein
VKPVNSTPLNSTKPVNSNMSFGTVFAFPYDNVPLNSTLQGLLESISTAFSVPRLCAIHRFDRIWVLEHYVSALSSCESSKRFTVTCTLTTVCMGENKSKSNNRAKTMHVRFLIFISFHVFCTSSPRYHTGSGAQFLIHVPSDTNWSTLRLFRLFSYVFEGDAIMHLLYGDMLRFVSLIIINQSIKN